MDIITYDGSAQTVTIQPPTPDPVIPAATVYNLAQLQTFIATEQSDIDNITNSQIPQLQSQIIGLQNQIAVHEQNIANWNIYIAGISAAETP